MLQQHFYFLKLQYYDTVDNGYTLFFWFFVHIELQSVLKINLFFHVMFLHVKINSNIVSLIPFSVFLAKFSLLLVFKIHEKVCNFEKMKFLSLINFLQQIQLYQTCHFKAIYVFFKFKLSIFESFHICFTKYLVIIMIIIMFLLILLFLY